jgi:hypothetical protein
MQEVEEVIDVSITVDTFLKEMTIETVEHVKNISGNVIMDIEVDSDIEEY